MTPLARKRSAGDRTYLWLACIFALCAGYYISVYRIGAAIDMQHDLSANVATMVRSNNESLAARPALEQTERTLDVRLGELQLHADHATTVARFIRATARFAAARHTTLVQIDERHPESASVRGSQAAGNDELVDSILLDVTLSGAYRDLIATIRALAQAPMATRIEIAAIERVAADGTKNSAPLTARLHITVERLGGATPTSAAAAYPSQETLHARSF